MPNMLHWNLISTSVELHKTHNQTSKKPQKNLNKTSKKPLTNIGRLTGKCSTVIGNPTKSLPATAGSTFCIYVASKWCQGGRWDPCKWMHNEWSKIAKPD